MNFASDNAGGVHPRIMAALAAANDGHVPAYGGDRITRAAQDLLREVFDAPDAAVHFVPTGTAANALSLSLLAPGWGKVFCHQDAHIQTSETGAPEFFTGGAKLVTVPGTGGKITPEALTEALILNGRDSVHAGQNVALSLTNATEWGRVYDADEVAALTAMAHAQGLACHMDGARFVNALVSLDLAPADLTWRAGIDVLSLGGTKNGCMGVEAVVIFDPAKAWEFELRRKRAGHLMSKHRFLSAQMAAYLEDGLWLRLAAHANAMAARLARGLAQMPEVDLVHPVEANILFPEWAEGIHAKLETAGAAYYPFPAPMGRERARLVASWSTTEREVDEFLSTLRDPR